VVDGIQKNVIDCNWKIAVDNLFDWYHVHVQPRVGGAAPASSTSPPSSIPTTRWSCSATTATPSAAREWPKAAQAKIDMMSDDERRNDPGPGRPSRACGTASATELMGPNCRSQLGHPNIFPNLWITLNGMQCACACRVDRHKTELWWFTLLPKNAPPGFPPAGGSGGDPHVAGRPALLEQDDGENWSQSTPARRAASSSQPARPDPEHGSRPRRGVTMEANGQRLHRHLRQRAWPKVALSVVDRVDGRSRLDGTGGRPLARSDREGVMHGQARLSRAC